MKVICISRSDAALQTVLFFEISSLFSPQFAVYEDLELMARCQNFASDLWAMIYGLDQSAFILKYKSLPPLFISHVFLVIFHVSISRVLVFILRLFTHAINRM